MALNGRLFEGFDNPLHYGNQRPSTKVLDRIERVWHKRHLSKLSFACSVVLLLFIISPVRASWDSECEAVMPDSISGYPLDSSHIVRGTAAHGCYHAYQIGNPDLVYPFVKKPSGIILSCGAYGTGIGTTDLAGEIVQAWIKYDESSCYSVEQSNALAAEVLKYMSGRQTFDVDGITIIEQIHTDSSNHVYAGYSFYLGHFYAGVLYEHVGSQTDSQRREKPIEAIRQIIQKIEARESCAAGGTVATPTPTQTPTYTAIPTSYASEECKSVDLSEMPVYKVDLAEHKCSSWTETKSDGYYKIGCNLEAGTVRAYGINAVDVPSGAGTLRIKATLKTTDSRVHYDDYADLIVFTMDKGPELSLTCGKSTTDWPNECVIKDRITGSLGHCGLPKYTGSRACDFTVDVSGLNTIYLTFSMSDPWDLAFGALKDSFENVEICVEKTVMPTPALQPTETATPTPTETPTPRSAKNLDGQSCASDSECESGNCRGMPNGICCRYGEQCCRTAHLLCVPGYECGPEHYCVPEADQTSKKPNGSRCVSDSRCLSGHCQYGRCCEAGKTCCEYTSNCPDDYYCGSFSTCTIDQRLNTYPCTSDAGCLSGWCSLFKCADRREIVVSAGPETDPEAGQIKRMIEKDIYPAIVAVFGGDSGHVFTGPRDYDYEIKLQLVFDTPTAMWDEKTNTLYVPASKVYANMGAYSPKMMQLNALAHELTHYHLNGFALKDGGDFGKVPLWFREGLAEYGAHAFYKAYMDSSALSGYLGGMVIPPTSSVSEAREIRFRDYLSDGTIQYRETIEPNALDKVSWLGESSMDTNINEYAHVYYGAAFSFVNYLLGKDTYKEGESMMDVAKYMFMMGSKGKFGFYGHADDEKNPYPEKSIKKGWFEQFINKHEIDTATLKSKPSMIKTITDGVGSIFRGLWSLIFK